MNLWSLVNRHVAKGDWRRRRRARGKAGLSCCQAVPQVSQVSCPLQGNTQYCKKLYTLFILTLSLDFLYQSLEQCDVMQERGIQCHSSTLWSRDIHQWDSQCRGLYVQRMSSNHFFHLLDSFWGYLILLLKARLLRATFYILTKQQDLAMEDLTNLIGAWFNCKNLMKYIMSVGPLPQIQK